MHSSSSTALLWPQISKSSLPSYESQKTTRTIPNCTLVPSTMSKEAVISRSLGRPVNIHVHSPGVTCPACEYLELANMQDDFAELPFSSAFPLWLDAHRPYVTKDTAEDYEQYGNPLLDFFKGLQLKKINKGGVMGYQIWRWKRGDAIPDETKSKYAHNAETVRIKNEINGVLKPMLIQAGTWRDILAKKFKHLPVPREGSGVALTLKEQSRILEVAFSRERWLLTAHCQRVMYKTGSGFGELKKLRRSDIDLDKGTITIILGAKNDGPRPRTVTLTSSALESIRWLIKRWHDHGGDSDDQFILFHRTKGFYMPMTSTHSAWWAILEETERRYAADEHREFRVKLRHTRQYDARPSAASVLMKNPANTYPMIEKALGWSPNSRMRKRYLRTEQEEIRQIMNTLEDAG
jgi:integrase